MSTKDAAVDLRKSHFRLSWGGECMVTKKRHANGPQSNLFNSLEADESRTDEQTDRQTANSIISLHREDNELHIQ